MTGNRSPVVDTTEDPNPSSPRDRSATTPAVDGSRMLDYRHRPPPLDSDIQNTRQKFGADGSAVGWRSPPSPRASGPLGVAGPSSAASAMPQDISLDHIQPPPMMRQYSNISDKSAGSSNSARSSSSGGLQGHVRAESWAYQSPRGSSSTYNDHDNDNTDNLHRSLTDGQSEPASGNPSSPRQRRTRVLMTKMQWHALIGLWEQTIFPATNEREALAQEIGLTPRQVQVWFQNQRQKRRRENEINEGNTASDALLASMPPTAEAPPDWSDNFHRPGSMPVRDGESVPWLAGAVNVAWSGGPIPAPPLLRTFDRPSIPSYGFPVDREIPLLASDGASRGFDHKHNHPVSHSIPIQYAHHYRGGHFPAAAPSQISPSSAFHSPFGHPVEYPQRDGRLDGRHDHPKDGRHDHPKDGRHDHRQDGRHDHRQDGRHDHPKDGRHDHPKDGRHDHRQDGRHDLKHMPSREVTMLRRTSTSEPGNSVLAREIREMRAARRTDEGPGPSRSRSISSVGNAWPYPYSPITPRTDRPTVPQRQPFNRRISGQEYHRGPKSPSSPTIMDSPPQMPPGALFSSDNEADSANLASARRSSTSDSRAVRQGSNLPPSLSSIILEGPVDSQRQLPSQLSPLDSAWVRSSLAITEREEEPSTSRIDKGSGMEQGADGSASAQTSPSRTAPTFANLLNHE